MRKQNLLSGWLRVLRQTAANLSFTTRTNTIAQECSHWCRVTHGLDPRLRGDDDWFVNSGVTAVEAEL